MLVRTLLHQGLLSESQDGYPVLQLNAHSREVLKGERAVQIALPSARTERRRRKDRAPATAVTSADEALFEALRSLRRQLATELKIPP